jgi:imidazolonepropionase
MAAEFKIFRNISELLTLAGVSRKDGRKILESDLGIISKAAMVVADGQIQWLGLDKKIPKHYAKRSIEINLNSASVLPGFVECHTHAVFAGNRAEEFELRNKGVSYQEINKRGGGILSTVRKTRKASPAVLKRSFDLRVQNFINQGVTTLEVKSGYALDLKNEIKLLKVMQSNTKIRIVPTFLGAHSLPPEFKTHAEYLNFIEDQIFPILAKKKLSNRVDVFIEKDFFTKEIARKFLLAAKGFNFNLVIHADQLSLSGGSDLACELHAVSADHLIQITEIQIQRFAKSQVTCVLLPTADLYMKCSYPPARKLIDAGARVALATDFNPGSSPTQDLNLVGLLARLEMKMTLPEVIAAYTYSAAAALNLQTEVGTLELGKRADFQCISSGWDELFYSVGSRNIVKSFSDGTSIEIR